MKQAVQERTRRLRLAGPAAHDGGAVERLCLHVATAEGMTQ